MKYYLILITTIFCISCNKENCNENKIKPPSLFLSNSHYKDIKYYSRANYIEGLVIEKWSNQDDKISISFGYTYSNSVNKLDNGGCPLSVSLLIKSDLLTEEEVLFLKEFIVDFGKDGKEFISFYEQNMDQLEKRESIFIKMERDRVTFEIGKLYYEQSMYYSLRFDDSHYHYKFFSDHKKH